MQYRKKKKTKQQVCNIHCRPQQTASGVNKCYNGLFERKWKNNDDNNNKLQRYYNDNVINELLFTFFYYLRLSVKLRV